MMTATRNLLSLDRIAATGGASLLLVRHGQTDHNRQRLFNGRGDTQLDAVGQQQAVALASFLQSLPLAGAWSSPLVRARQTAAPVLSERVLPLQLDERLAELDQGELEGQPARALMEHHSAFFERWVSDPSDARVPGGETMREVQQRMLEALSDIAASAPEGGAPVLVVSHNMAISAALCGILGRPLGDYRRLGQENAAVTVLVARGGELSVAERNVRPAR
ncbi:MAG: broad specificity phosphatase PhoE [Myxococcota bacterium]|jgi:broad specificity phosphatase PhoE